MYASMSTASCPKMILSAQVALHPESRERLDRRFMGIKVILRLEFCGRALRLRTVAEKRNIAPGGTRGSVFKEVARIRLDDGETLLLRGRYNGAIYMAGYAIECLLKWAVTSRTGRIYLPAELETHTWDVLLDAAGLYEDLASHRALQAIYAELADRWGPDLRYRSKALLETEAKRLYDHMELLYDWIREQAI